MAPAPRQLVDLPDNVVGGIANTKQRNMVANQQSFGLSTLIPVDGKPVALPTELFNNQTIGAGAGQVPNTASEPQLTRSFAKHNLIALHSSQSNTIAQQYLG